MYSRMSTVSKVSDFVCVLTSVEHSCRHGTLSSRLRAGRILLAEESLKGRECSSLYFPGLSGTL